MNGSTLVILIPALLVMMLNVPVIVIVSPDVKDITEELEFLLH